jgi:hypothetical protein
LVVDTSDPPDGVCDDINPDLVPTSKPQTDVDAQVLDMVPLSSGGTADYSPEPGSPCSSTSGEPPKPLCPTTVNAAKALWDNKGKPHSDSMTVALNYAVKKHPSIYTLGPIVGDDLQCAGRQFDASNNLKDGWACLAVRASDTLGNMQVSRPIRICVVARPGSTACDERKTLTRLVPSDPLEIQTATPLLGAGGAPLQPGDEVVVAGVASDASAIGQWKVDPLDASGTRFSLRGSQSRKLTFCKCANATCGSYSSCPQVALKLELTTGQPIVVVSSAAHGLAADFSGYIVLFGNTEQALVAEMPWQVTVIDATHFTLKDSLATAPVKPGGYVVPVSVMPDCTGTVIKAGQDGGGLPSVDYSRPCRSWLAGHQEYGWGTKGHTPL